MFYYVEDKEFLRRTQSWCSSTIKELENECRNKGINSQMFLVGSGGRNMVTKNENGAIDFDYNLNILSCPNWDDTREIKEVIRKAFNAVMRRKGLRDVQDSTSSLTTDKIYFEDEPDIEFSIDVAIVTKDDNGIWERLIHQKTGRAYLDRYIWNEVRDSTGVGEKAMAIKQAHCWQYVRERYLEKKNFYLIRNDYDHPSFVCYIEAVNEVYNQLR